jgi:hypothetical protein
MESEYRIDRGGTRIVMSFDVFKNSKFEAICKQLGLKPTDMHFSQKEKK